MVYDSVVKSYELKTNNPDRLKNWLSQTENRYEANFIDVESDGNIHINWNERKIIGYWFPHFLIFIRNLAEFVDGYISLSEGPISAVIIFRSEGCYVEIHRTIVEPVTLDELMKNHLIGWRARITRETFLDDESVNGEEEVNID